MSRLIRTLSSGNIAAQFIQMLSLCIAGYLYQPADFGILQQFISLAAIVIIICTFRLDVLMPYRINDAKYKGYLQLHIIAMCVVIMALGVILFRARCFSGKMIWLNSFSIWFAFTIIFATVSQYYTQWLACNKNVRIINRIKILQTTVSGIIVCTMPLIITGPHGLIAGQFACYSIGAFAALHYIIKYNILGYRRIHIEDIIKYIAQCTIMTVSSLVNVVSSQMPVIILSAMASNHDVGIYSMAFRCLQVPTTSIGSAISTSFAAVSSNSRSVQTTKCDINNHISIAVFYGALLFSIITIICIPIFNAYASGKWHESQYMVVGCIPWYCIMFVFTPVSIIVFKDKMYKYETIFQTILLVARCLVLYLGVRFANPLTAIWCFSFVSCLLWGAYGIGIARIYNVKLIDIIKKCKRVVILLCITWLCSVEHIFLSARTIDSMLVVCGTIIISAVELKKKITHYK